MHLTEGSFYHVFNRGNNKQLLFYQERNYEYFIRKIRQYVASHSNLVAWCLMPNHFHILIQATGSSTKLVKEKPIPINAFTEGLRIMLSSYSQAIQKQENLTGSLFQQKTKCKCIDSYLTEAFHYIHQNPYRAGLAKTLEDYPWSSFKEYAEGYGRHISFRAPEQSSELLCQQEIAWQFLNFEKGQLIRNSYEVIPDEVVRKIEF